MSIEQIIKDVDNFEPVKFLRMEITRFMENLSFNESYLKKVKEYKENKEKIDFYNIFKEIRMRKK